MNKEAVICEQFGERLKKPPLNKKVARVVLETCADILNSLGVDWWISGGTMLGAYRDGDFIEWDYDIDVEMVGNHEEVIEEIDKLAPRYRNLFRKDNGQQIQAMWRFPENTLLDLFIYRRDERGLVSYSLMADKEIIYPPDMGRDQVQFNGKYYPCLDPERYLRYVYGETWKIPHGPKAVYGNC